MPRQGKRGTAGYARSLELFLQRRVAAAHDVQDCSQMSIRKQFLPLCAVSLASSRSAYLQADKTCSEQTELAKYLYVPEEPWRARIG